MTRSFHNILRIAILLLFLGGAGSSYADSWKYGIPRAASGAKNDVSYEQALNVARNKAREKWGQVTLGPVFSLSDSEGGLKGYLCVFRIGGNEFGDPDSLLQTIENAKERLKAKGEKRVNSPKKTVLKTAHRSFDLNLPENKRPQGLEAVTVLSVPEKDSSGGDAADSDLKERWGIGTYGTVVVSASTSQVPVPQVIHGLPPAFTHLREMRGQCQAKGFSEPLLDRIVYRSPAQQIYGFTDGKGNALWMDAQKGKICEAPKALKKETDSPEKEILRAKNREEWKRHGVTP